MISMHALECGRLWVQPWQWLSCHNLPHSRASMLIMNPQSTTLESKHDNHCQGWTHSLPHSRASMLIIVSRLWVHPWQWLSCLLSSVVDCGLIISMLALECGILWVQPWHWLTIYHTREQAWWSLSELNPQSTTLESKHANQCPDWTHNLPHSRVSMLIMNPQSTTLESKHDNHCQGCGRLWVHD
jgi:hypothetical protein